MVTQHDLGEFEIPEITSSKQSRFQSLRENLSILLAPVRLASPSGGSQPFQIGGLWSRSERLGRAQWLSLAAHGLLIALLTLSVARTVTQPKNNPAGVRTWLRNPLLSYQAPKPSTQPGAPRGDGSGGNRNPDPASAGTLPRFSGIQLAPPSLRDNSNAALRVEPTLLGPSIPAPKTLYPNFGIPDAPNLTTSQGPGGGDGFGDNKLGIGGVGSGEKGHSYGPGGDGVGVTEGGKFGASYPECTYCPAPSFSDDARRAKIQGQVELRIVVTPDGRASNIQVIRGLGLGLDERAVEAVRNWRFKPSLDAARRPTAVWITIEVTFRLL